MKFNPFKFALIFWSAFVIILTAHCYTRAINILKKCSFTNGKVIDHIPVIKRGFRSKKVMRPQVEYMMDWEIKYFVDEDTYLEIGDKPRLIYWTNDPSNIHVYSFWMWVHWSAIIPSFLICLLVFKVILILFSKPGPEPEILPGNF